MNHGRLAVGVLASGSGSNFEAIAEAAASGSIDAQVRVVICNRPGAGVLAKAQHYRIPTVVLDHRGYKDRPTFDAAVADALQQAGVELVALAGFDRLVTATLLERFPDRVMNIHPALLPSFKGLDAQDQAAEYGVTIAGCTVHFVDESVDHGPIIVQAAVPTVPGEDPHRLRQRILRQEHRIYPWAIELYAQGRLRIEGRKVIVRGIEDATDFDGAIVQPPLPAAHRSAS
jgi:phosphoribosylglycinamide formyltransferase-1